MSMCPLSNASRVRDASFKEAFGWQERNHGCSLYAHNLSETELKTVSNSELLLSVEKKKVFCWVFLVIQLKIKSGVMEKKD